MEGTWNSIDLSGTRVPATPIWAWRSTRTRAVYLMRAFPISRSSPKQFLSPIVLRMKMPTLCGQGLVAVANSAAGR